MPLEQLLHFLFFSFYSPVSLSLDLGRPNTQKRRLGTDRVWREAFEFRFKEYESGFPMFRGRGNASVFSLCQQQEGRSDCSGGGGLLHKNLEGGEPFSLIGEPWS